eukprot:m.139432 g.139432  ORF g.139432 m.139432 type:complete len:59 (-) comp17626_c0_seq5:884-1060(-)
MHQIHVFVFSDRYNFVSPADMSAQKLDSYLSSDIYKKKIRTFGYQTVSWFTPVSILVQ